VARAKPTARADARRRTRIANRPVEDDVLDMEDQEAEEAPSARPASRTSSAAARRAPGGRPPFLASFRSAYRRPNIREDLILLPRLVIHQAFLAGVGLIVLGAVVFAIWPGYSGSTLAFQFLTLPPAYAPIFVIGFFAPRATYLLGALVGVIDALVYAILIATLPGGAPDQVALAGYVGVALFWSVVTGTLFASGIAWYRRFLSVTSPRRAPAKAGQQSRAKAQPATARRRY